MLKIKVGNSSCSVGNPSLEQVNALRRELSYSEKKRAGGYRKTFGSERKYLIDKRGTFPTGLLYLVEETLTKKGWTFEVEDTRVRPVVGKFAPNSLFIDTSMIARLEQKIAAMAAKENGRGIIVAPTGCGKSFIAALVLDTFQVKSLIVVPSLELKRQLTDSLREWFGPMVGPLVNGEAKFFITVENVDQLEPAPLPGVDLVLIDEFHHSAAKSYRDLNMKAWNTVYFKFGLTATPFRSKDEERLLLESVLSKVIYQVDYYTAVDKGYISRMEVFFYDLPAIKFEGSAENWHNVYKKLIVEREDRNELICDMVQNLVAEKKSTLVLVKQVEHGLKLQHMLAVRGVKVPLVCGVEERNRELIQSFNDREELCLIGTSVIGEGVDTRPTEFVILAGGGKSKPAFMQQLGRGFRRFPGKDQCNIVMFNDNSHHWLLNHFKECTKILKQEYGITAAKLG